jgi:thioredoxin 1
MSSEITITDTNFDTETASGVTLIDFWAPWCGPCKMQGPIIEKVAEKMEGKAKVGKCNVDEEPNLSRKFSIMAIPTLIIFKDGKETERIMGLQSEAILVEKLNSLSVATGS